MSRGQRIAGVGVVTVVFLALVALYLFDFLFVSPAPVSAAISDGTAHLVLQTVPTYGHSPDPDWVSYLAEDAHGHWQHTTYFKIPAHTLVSVTIYNYDTPTGLRNNFMGQVRGTTGGTIDLDGKPLSTLDPDDTSHTWSVPDLGINIPIGGVNPNAKNPCSAAPCSLAEAHTTVTFTFMSPGKGNYRWQCFVPCAAGFYLGNGGPMQTIGWMDGVLEVV
jgi:hypothetical protein